jgi:hypothetical protein
MGRDGDAARRGLEGRRQRREVRGQVSVFRCQEVKGKKLILSI